MLTNAPIRAYLPASNLPRAQKILRRNRRPPAQRRIRRSVIYECGGAEVSSTPPPTPAPPKATQAYWSVTDVEAEVADLKSRGVKFEEYNMPGIKMTNSIATGGGAKTAWFKDTEGNILAVSQRLT